MPFSHYASEGIAWLVGRGTGDLQAWRAAMVAVLSDPRVGPDTPILWDCRHLESFPTASERRVVATTLATLAPSHRVAVVTQWPAAFGAAVRLEAVANGQVMAFDTDVVSAIRWLRAHQDGRVLRGRRALTRSISGARRQRRIPVRTSAERSVAAVRPVSRRRRKRR